MGELEKEWIAQRKKTWDSYLKIMDKHNLTNDPQAEHFKKSFDAMTRSGQILARCGDHTKLVKGKIF